MLGGKGERRLLPLVARYADHWNYSGDDPAEFTRLRGRLVELCDGEERSVDDLTLSANVRPSADAPSRILEQIAEYRDAGAHMVCVLLPRPYDPRLLERLAPVLADVA